MWVTKGRTVWLQRHRSGRSEQNGLLKRTKDSDERDVEQNLDRPCQIVRLPNGQWASANGIGQSLSQLASELRPDSGMKQSNAPESRRLLTRKMSFRRPVPGINCE
jgi:hypothetical protein